MSGIPDLHGYIAERVFHAPELFGQAVIYRDAHNTEWRLTITGAYRRRDRRNDDGTADTVETLTVGILRAELPDEPATGSRIYRPGDERAFVYVGEAPGQTDTRWKCIFVRTTPTGQAAGGRR
jgi:hypothetical protein